MSSWFPHSCPSTIPGGQKRPPSDSRILAGLLPISLLELHMGQDCVSCTPCGISHHLLSPVPQPGVLIGKVRIPKLKALVSLLEVARIQTPVLCPESLLVPPCCRFTFVPTAQPRPQAPTTHHAERLLVTYSRFRQN